MNASNSQPNESGGDSFARFESLLRQDLGEPSFDWTRLENRLFERIAAAEAQGPMAQIKADVLADAALFERIENNLMARIAAHKEYEQPVDDVIASPAPSLEGQWVRMENRIDNRIGSLQEIPAWELALKANEQPAPALYERIEDGLFDRIATQESLQPVVTHQPAPLVDHLAPTTTGFSLVFAWLTRSTLARVTALSLIVVGLSLYGYRAFDQNFTPLATMIYETQGFGIDEAGSNELRAGISIAAEKAPILASGEGKAVTVVNRRGFVELRNGAAVQLEKANQREVRYRYAPLAHKPAAGKATFFVAKRKAKENFVVTTPDYRIEVLGTYFQVHPDLNGKVATTVLEGKVHIRSQELGDIYLSQGQSFVFDEATGQYKVVGGGPVVAREAIENLPEMQALGSYQVLAISANVPQAEVTLDGRYRGIAPMAILQAPGEHRIRLSKPGFHTLDTVINLAAGQATRLALVLQSEPTASAQIAQVQTRPAKPDVRAERVVPAMLPTPTLDEKPQTLNAEEVFRQAEAAQGNDWVLAIKLYEEYLSQGIPGMRREAALFSIARLRADHSQGSLAKVTAKQEFLDYLARYPQGAFAGESWLRLAELELEGQPDKAIEYYLKVFERYPRHHRLSELQYRVGLIYLQQKRYDEAAGMFRQGLTNVLADGDDEKRKLLQGLHRALVAKGDSKAAERVESDLQKAEKR